MTALSAEVWVDALTLYAASDDITVSTMAQMLIDIINVSEWQPVAAVLDHHASRLLEMS